MDCIRNNATRLSISDTIYGYNLQTTHSGTNFKTIPVIHTLS